MGSSFDLLGEDGGDGYGSLEAINAEVGTYVSKGTYGVCNIVLSIKTRHSRHCWRHERGSSTE